MTNKYDELINEFEARLRLLMSEYESLKIRNSELKVELEYKQNDLMLAHQEILTWKKKYDHLQVAKFMGDSEEQRSLSKLKLARMVREIDKCLALLND